MFLGSGLRTLRLNLGQKYFLLCSLVEEALYCFILYLDLSSIFSQFSIKCKNYFSLFIHLFSLLGSSGSNTIELLLRLSQNQSAMHTCV